MMRILGITNKRYLKATMAVVGDEADLLISPPLRCCCITPEHLQGYDFIYIDLHGEAGKEFLYSQDEEGRLIEALRVETIRQAKLEGTVVFATSCYLPETPFIEAFLKAGVKAVIAGEGENYGKLTKTSGAQRLAKNLIEELERGGRADTQVCPNEQVHHNQVRIDEALLAAKEKMKGLVSVFDREGTKDSLEFSIYSGNGREPSLIKEA